MRKCAVAVFACLAFTALSATARAAENGKFSLGTGVFRSSGHYGGVQSTDILYIPIIAKYRTKKWRYKLVVPYLRITGPGNVLNGIGVTGNPAATTRTTEAGLGDIIAAATRSVYDGGTSGLMVSFTGKIKLGTADAARGLGTGQNDYAFQGNVAQAYGHMTAFGSLGYRIYGQPAAYKLKNVFYGTAGAIYKFTPDMSAGLMFNFRQQALVNGFPKRQALLFVNQQVNREWKAEAYALKGFTSGSPDFGAGLTITRTF